MSDLAANWDSKAQDWDQQVGEYGDTNRRLHSDPLVWRWLGDVKLKQVLDVGCGTGYFCRQLVRKGARVTGVDISSEMIRLAGQRAAECELGMALQVDDAAELRTQPERHFDKLICNYVLMDMPDLDSAVFHFYRVLKPGGQAVVVITHPCFPLGLGEEHAPGQISFHWPFPYLEEKEIQEAPWGHFKTPFYWYHRPLSRYWEAFHEAGFEIINFAEPCGQIPGDDAESQSWNARARSRPNSAIFLLQR